MKKILSRFFIFFGSVLLPITVICQTGSWDDVKVMISNRSDVRRIFQKTDDGSIFDVFSIKEGTVTISYSFGKCTCKVNSGWNIPDDTVVELKFTPLTEVYFSMLKVNLKQFKKIKESPDVPDIITYINSREGVRYVIQPDGLVSTIAYFPATKYDELRCPSN